MKRTEAKGTESRVFVDAVEGKTARLLLGEVAFDVPVALLPKEAREGTWVRLLAEVIPAPPDDTEERRAKLGRGDPGGDIKL